MPTPASLDHAVRTLYDGPASSFIATRKELAAQAKASGDVPLSREITALRKPTASAEVVNHLEPDSLGELLGVGAALRAAQTRLDTDELKRLTGERQRLLHGIVTGIDASATVRDEVRSTLLAATADPAAESAVESRALVRALRYSGWGEVDVSDALAHRDAALRGRAALRLVESSDDGASEQSVEGPGETTDDAASEATPPDADVVAPASSKTQPEPEDPRVAQRAADLAAALGEVERAERRLRAATDAYDAAKAARASAQAALDIARGRVDTLRTQ